MGARLSVHPSLVVGTALAGAVLAGTAMVQSVQLGVAAVVALCYVPLALLNLPLAIVLWLPSVALITVTALDVAPNLAGIMILLAWVGALAARRSTVPELIVQHARVLVLLGALVLWVILSMAWAQEPALGSGIFFGWIAAGTIVLVISTALTDRRYLRLAAGALVVGAVVSVALGLLGGAIQAPSASSPESTGRIVGGSGDPNFLAAGIVPAIVLAAGLGVGSPRLAGRLAALAAVAFLTIGLAGSESRGGFVAAIVAGVVVLLLAKRHRAWTVALLLCVVGVAVAWFSAYPEAWERLSDFQESNGRTELWGVALQMWQDHPLVGVGLQGFVDNAGDYVRELGPLQYAEFISEQPKVVHNTYLELLAETGVVGFALFVAVVFGCLRGAWRAAAHFERLGDTAMAALARSVIAGVVAMLASAAFISGATDRRLWVLLALGPVLLACATHQVHRSDSDSTVEGSPRRSRSPRRGVRPSARVPSLRTRVVRGAARRPTY